MKYFKFLTKFTIILIIIYYSVALIASKLFGIHGFNKTVGWAWDILGTIPVIFLIYIIFYLTLFALKIKTYLTFTVASFLTLFFCLLLFNGNEILMLILFAFSILLFVSNILYSIYLKLRQL